MYLGKRGELVVREKEKICMKKKFLYERKREIPTFKKEGGQSSSPEEGGKRAPQGKKEGGKGIRGKLSKTLARIATNLERRKSGHCSRPSVQGEKKKGEEILRKKA